MEAISSDDDSDITLIGGNSVIAGDISGTGGVDLDTNPWHIEVL